MPTRVISWMPIVSKRLIESIFFKNSPLHDGAIIISDNKIKAARCVFLLPKTVIYLHSLACVTVQHLEFLNKVMPLAIIVSEETGKISVATDGKIISNLSPDELEKYLIKEIK